MKEVSCRVLDLHFRKLEEQGHPPELMARETPYDIAHLRDKNERIEWDVHSQIMRNLATVWSEDDFVDVGRSFFENPMIRPVSLVGRLLFEPRDFYWWFAKPRKGGGNQLFTCIEPSVRELGPGRIEITLTTSDGYTPCREFFIVSKGTFTQLPRAVGKPPAKVTMRETERGAVYEIELPEGRSVWGEVRRAVTRPFLTNAVAEELDETHYQLVERYAQLERAQALVDRQATQLKTAHTISLVVHGDLDLVRVVQAVAKALVDVAGFAGAEVSVNDSEGAEIARHVVGDTPEQATPMVVELTSRSRDLGRMRLWPSADANRSERGELLEYLVPTVSMAIDDALTFAEVEDYRANLERKVTERTRELASARDELEQTVLRLEEAQTARDRIFANINHELRTPLANITLAVDRIRRDHGEQIADGSLIRGIEFNVSQLLQLMDGLLLLAAGDEGKLELRRSPTDVAELCRLVAESWMPSAEQHGIALELDLAKRAPATIDRDGIARVVGNLLSNAVKHTPEGGHVVLSVTCSEDDVTIGVRDDGVGMSPELRAHVFERFVQGPSPVRTATRGAGIGLSIVDELVRAHGGSADVQSDEGEGTSFVVRLPRGGATEADDLPLELPGSIVTGHEKSPIASVDEVPVVAPTGASADTILIAEDDPDLRRFLGELLRERYRVIVAPDGERALELAQTHHPDLLLTDVSMPKMDGHELARAFRELPGQRLAPVLMLTAHGQRGDRIAGFEAGAIDYMLKPFDPDELRERVAAQLRQRDLAVRLSESERLASLAILSAGLAHEFRNPANGIVNAMEGLTYVLPQELQEEGPAAELLDVMRASATQLRGLCKQLLGFAGPERLDTAPQAISALVERAMLIAQPTVNDIEVRTRLDYTGELVCAAPFVVQVLVNLIENACHAAGESGWIEVSTQAADATIHLRVRDSGPGVPDDLREKIFQPFFTTKSPGKGTGLGLPVSRRILEQHGGRLRVVSVEDTSAFEAVFPRVASAAAQ